MGPARPLPRLGENLPDVDSDFALAVIEGLAKTRKMLPCRFFYDARGSALFEEITRLPEYYPTRTETAILRAYASEMAADTSDNDVLVEFGSGSSLKTEILLEQMRGRITYVPIDVSETALADAKARLSRRYPNVDIRPIVADFSAGITLPDDLSRRRRIGFFPGSTIGNLSPREAQRLLRSFAATLGDTGRLIIGVDLKKDVRRLVAAYNDAAGVTAEFNLNLLTRINRELGGTIDERAFRHLAIYNPREGRIEMHLVSPREQTIEVLGREFYFRANESIHTENSYKYTLAEFRDLAHGSGWLTQRTWIDPGANFSVHALAR